MLKGPRVIERSIQEAEISDKYRPWCGDCANIAVATYRIFNSKHLKICSISRHINKENVDPDHVFLQYWETLIDGTGIQTAENLSDAFHLEHDFNQHFSRITLDEATEICYYSSDRARDIQNLIIEN